MTNKMYAQFFNQANGSPCSHICTVCIVVTCSPIDVSGTCVWAHSGESTMDRWIYRQRNRWTDNMTEAHTDRQTEEQTNRQTEGRTKLMNRWKTDRQMYRQTDGQMEGWTNREWGSNMVKKCQLWSVK